LKKYFQKKKPIQKNILLIQRIHRESTFKFKKKKKKVHSKKIFKENNSYQSFFFLEVSIKRYEIRNKLLFSHKILKNMISIKSFMERILISSC